MWVYFSYIFTFALRHAHTHKSRVTLIEERLEPSHKIFTLASTVWISSAKFVVYAKPAVI